MRRNRELHGLLLSEKYEIKDTKLKKGNNSQHQHQWYHFMSSMSVFGQQMGFTAHWPILDEPPSWRKRKFATNALLKIQTAPW